MPVSVGTMFFPWAIKKTCFVSPPIISARVAGVPMPYVAAGTQGRHPGGECRRLAARRAAGRAHRIPWVIGGAVNVVVALCIGGLNHGGADLARNY
jgi:hypothetical protein